MMKLTNFYICMNAWIVLSLIIFASYEYLGEQITYSKIYCYFIAAFVVNIAFAYVEYRENKINDQ